MMVPYGITQALHDFESQHRNVRLRITEGEADQLRDGLRRRTLDLAFIREWPGASKRPDEDMEFESMEFAEDRLAAVLPAGQARDTVALNLTESHKTVKNIKARGAFTVSIADAAHLVEADYFGVETGNKTPDKFDRSGLTACKAETVAAPVINEFPICLECEFIEYQSNEYGCGVIGKVVSVTADESVMVDGKIDMSLVNAIAFDPYTHGYYKVTERVGDAFMDGLALKK